MPHSARMPRDQRRSQLLETAITLFTQNGFHATSMDDIAAAASVTKPVLYQHFSSKEDLYSEVVRLTGQRLIEGAHGLAQIEGGTLERVRAGISQFYQLVASQAALRLFTGHEHISDAVAKQVTEVLDDMARTLTPVLLASRSMTDAQARVIGRAMITLAQSTAAMMHDASATDQEEILQTAAELAVRCRTGFEPLQQPGEAGTASSSAPVPGPQGDG